MTEGIEKKSHPWGEFLNARFNCILYFSEQGLNDTEIATTLSCDAHQIKAIKLACNISGKEE